MNRGRAWLRDNRTPQNNAGKERTRKAKIEVTQEATLEASRELAIEDIGEALEEYGGVHAIAK